MKDLFFRISMNAHTFDIRINQRNTLCWYSIDDKYKTSLTFAKNTYANVSYKNIRFNFFLQQQPAVQYKSGSGLSGTSAKSEKS